MSVVKNDFKIKNNWIPDENGPKWGQIFNYPRNHPTYSLPVYLIDRSTQRRYLNEKNLQLDLSAFY